MLAMYAFPQKALNRVHIEYKIADESEHCLIIL